MNTDVQASALAVVSCAEPEVVGLAYDVASLVVNVHDHRSGNDIEVKFVDVEGFRVLDESYLLEFWPNCSTNNGWLYQVFGGGWYGQECSRSESLAQAGSGLLEFILVGMNSCVSVLAWSFPAIGMAVIESKAEIQQSSN